MMGKGLSERRACFIMGMRRKSLRYEAVGGRKGEERLIERVIGLALKYPRYGYQRIWAMLVRAGEIINRKRVYRLWKRLGLGLARRRPKKRGSSKAKEKWPVATEINQIWTYDFVFDQAVSGRKLKMLTLVDEYTRECLAVEVGGSITARNVRTVLERVCYQRDFPVAIRSDNRSEFIATATREWLEADGVKPLFIDPGKPWQNGKGESFNGKLRDELLSRRWFCSLREAQIVIESGRKYYNTERPHSALGYMTPIEFRARLTESLATHQEWRWLIMAHSVQGVLIHDARTVSVMNVHGITHLLTFDKDDFKRFPGIIALAPLDVT